MQGDLTITGPGVCALFRGSDAGAATLIVEGLLPAGRRAARPLAARAGAAGLDLTIRDGRGRELLRVGPDLHSPLGRVLLGTSRARPTVRGLLAVRRGAARSHVLPENDPGGSTS